MRFPFAMFALAIGFAQACGGDDTEDPGTASGGTGSGGTGGGGGSGGVDASTDLEGALSSQGFSVTAGAFRVIDIADCCAVGKTCSGNNPSSPYAAFYLPRGPNQTVANPGEGPDGTSPSFRLAADEAVIYVGTTPPVAKYFGYTPYLIDRADATGVRKPVFASLTETLNNGVVAVNAATPFSQPVAIVAAADATTEGKVRTALETSGVDPAAINTIVFDPAIAKLGVDDADDSVGVLFRVALFDDANAGKAFLDAPPGVLLRATPEVSAASDPLPSPAARPKDASNSESALASALDALEAAVIAANSGSVATSLFVTKGEPDPLACIQNLTFCAGDNRDTIYPSILPRMLWQAPEDFYIVIGVNHAAMNKVSYSSFSVYAIEHLVGVASVTSAEYAQSALDYLPTHPDAPNLYAWKVARQCGSDPHCLAIPDAGCPTGVGAGKLGTITFRAYLEPATSTAPDPATLVLDRVIRFSAT